MSDRFSLAVLLFYMFMLGHPLKGKRELTLPYDGSDPDKLGAFARALNM